MQLWHKLLEDRERLFWTLHTTGWAGFALVYYLGTFVIDVRPVMAFVILLNANAGWLLTIPLRYVYHRSWQSSPLKKVIIVLLASYVVAVLWTVVKNLNLWEIYKHGYRPDEWIQYLRNTADSFMIIICWSGLYFGAKYALLLEKEKRNVLRASTMAHQAHLKMLRYQLNPHFLFNTLNAISTLILVNKNDTAGQMVTKLSEFLRYSLDKDPIKKVPLYQEVQAINLYLDIEKVRFAERLEVSWDINKESEQALVPSLILQPLVENAIKYAISKMTDGGRISLSATHFGRDLLLEVSDNGPGTELKEGRLHRENGVGIPNIHDRLKSLYGGNYSFTMAHNEPSGLKISIRIPYEEGEDG